MVASASTAADIVNLALTRIGWKQGIGNLYDGSAASQLALQVYGQTRDELLRRMAPQFAIRNLAMTLLKSAPAGGYIPGVSPWNPAVNPPVNWLFEYVYPEDCLKVRAVKPVPLFVLNFDPQPNIFSIDNDSAYSPPRRVVLCNVPDALLVYVGRVTDPTTMDVSFVETFAATLGERLAPALAGLDAAKLEAVDAQISAGAAQTEQG